MKFQTKTGSEWHSTERRGCYIKVDGQHIWKALKPISLEWVNVGTKGRHGEWCLAEYDIPVGSVVTFIATANRKPTIEHTFTVSDDTSVDFDGYTYNSSICGWVVSI